MTFFKSNSENFDTRRLRVAIERIMVENYFGAAKMENGNDIIVDKELIQKMRSDLLVSSDISRYVL